MVSSVDKDHIEGREHTHPIGGVWARPLPSRDASLLADALVDRKQGRQNKSNFKNENMMIIIESQEILELFTCILPRQVGETKGAGLSFYIGSGFDRGTYIIVRCEGFLPRSYPSPTSS
jgi:hypothetical protein